MSEKKPNLSPKELKGDEKLIDELAKKENITHAAAAARLVTAKHNEQAKREADANKAALSAETNSQVSTVKPKA
jgi:hypothetical protein